MLGDFYKKSFWKFIFTFKPDIIEFFHFIVMKFVQKIRLDLLRNRFIHLKKLFNLLGFSRKFIDWFGILFTKTLAN